MKLIDLLKEEKIETEAFQEFSTTRQKGAEKIADNAKEKGGFAMLTYNHFIVKMPYYERAIKGNFDPEKAKEEYQELLDQLVDATNEVEISQTNFQKLVGKIEVLGELIIKSREK